MTDEERKQLCDEIRQFAPNLSLMRQYQACLEAVGEIERLAAQLKLVEETMRGLQVAFERGHNYD